MFLYSYFCLHPFSEQAEEEVYNKIDQEESSDEDLSDTDLLPYIQRKLNKASLFCSLNFEQKVC